MDVKREAFDLCSPLGVRVSATSCGIRRQLRPDLALFELAKGSETVAVFTRNAFLAAPIVISKKHLLITSPRYLLINSGNANAGMGIRGEEDALRCCMAVSELMGVAVESVLMFSTGVIGEDLPVDKILPALLSLRDRLSVDAWPDVAQAIMTTDTRPKTSARTRDTQLGTVQVCGIAKGSGMIHPNMATMLAFIVTDASLPKELLNEWLVEAVDISFHRITVDGDTSTNDSCVLISTGHIEVSRSEDLRALKEDVMSVFRDLARQIVEDGEGVTRPFTVSVHQGLTVDECLLVARAVSGSSLVKTAIHARDPNWGRILAAIGYAGLKRLDINKVYVALNDASVVEAGSRAPLYKEEQGQVAMNASDLDIAIYLGRGDKHASVYASDLSAEYVQINSNYRS